MLVQDDSAEGVFSSLTFANTNQQFLFKSNVAKFWFLPFSVFTFSIVNLPSLCCLNVKSHTKAHVLSSIVPQAVLVSPGKRDDIKR